MLHTDLHLAGVRPRDRVGRVRGQREEAAGVVRAGGGGRALRPLHRRD